MYHFPSTSSWSTALCWSSTYNPTKTIDKMWKLVWILFQETTSNWNNTEYCVLLLIQESVPNNLLIPLSVSQVILLSEVAWERKQIWLTECLCVFPVQGRNRWCGDRRGGNRGKAWQGMNHWTENILSSCEDISVFHILHTKARTQYTVQTPRTNTDKCRGSFMFRSTKCCL